MTNKQLIALAGALTLLLLVLLMPLVNMLSYHWVLTDVLHKLPRLVQDSTVVGVACVLLALLLAAPVLLAASALRAGGTGRLAAVLPAGVAVVAVVLLLVAGAPIMPGLGLWLYMLVALVMGGALMQKKN